MASSFLGDLGCEIAYKKQWVKIDLPELVDGLGFVYELACSLDHNKLPRNPVSKLPSRSIHLKGRSKWT